MEKKHLPIVVAAVVFVCVFCLCLGLGTLFVLKPSLDSQRSGAQENGKPRAQGSLLSEDNDAGENGSGLSGSGADNEAGGSGGLTEGAEAEKLLSDGWHEVNGGWRYAENGSFLSHCWRNIDGELYYFMKNGMMASQTVRLERQKFTFSGDGQLIGIEDADDGAEESWWDEDERYYLESGNLMHMDADGRAELVYDGQYDIGSFAVEGELICGYFIFCDEDNAFTIGTDGQNLQTQYVDYGLDTWFFESWPMDVYEGTAYYTGVPHYDMGENEPERGADILFADLFAVSEGHVTRLHEYKKNDRGEFENFQPIYIYGDIDKLQAAAEGVFCLLNECRQSPYGALPPKKGLALFTPGNRQLLIERDDIEQFFVCDGLICYMAGGQFLKESLSEAMTYQESDTDRIYGALLQELTNRYDIVPIIGIYRVVPTVDITYTVSEVDGYAKADCEPIREGILASCQEDMDMDGVPELLVFYPQNAYSPEGEIWGIDVRVEMYRISQGQAVLVSQTIMGEIVNTEGDWSTTIFMKTLGNRKLLGVSHELDITASMASTGFTGTNLYEYEAASDQLVQVYSGGYGHRNLTGGEIEQYESELASFGLTEPLSDEDPSCRFLVTSSVYSSYDDNLRQEKYSGSLIARYPE